MAFDITKALGDIGRKPEGAGAETRRELRYIPLQRIDTNPRNFYSVEGIDELAENIRMFGLMEPLIVKELPSGRYMLISGHRRRLALRQIAEGAENYPDSMQEPVACLVEPEGILLPGIEDPEKAAAARPLAEELKLIYANADTRVMSSADTAWQVRRIRELFTELQKIGYKFPGKMRDHVAAAAKVSATRVARLDVIDKGLTEPTLRQAWKVGTLGETSAYEIARRSPEAQHAAAAFTGPEALQKMTTDQVVGTMDYYASRAEEDRKAKEEWNRNVGTMAKATKADGDEKKFFDASEYMAERNREDALFREVINRNLQRFINEATFLARDINFLDLDRTIAINAIKKGGYHGGGTIDGGYYTLDGKGAHIDIKGHDRITRTWTELYDAMAAAALETVRRYQEPKKVSAADTGATASGWKTGAPPEPGDYAVRVGFGLKEDPRGCYTKVVTWTGSYWSEGNNVPIRDGLTIFRWVKLPEE